MKNLITKSLELVEIAKQSIALNEKLLQENEELVTLNESLQDKYDIMLAEAQKYYELSKSKGCCQQSEQHTCPSKKKKK